ncbi:hypothetical protein D9M70_505310 [compost metagenome]
MAAALMDLRYIVGMDGSTKRARRPCFSRGVRRFQLVPQILAKLFAAVDRITVRVGAFDHRRQGFNELSKRALTLAQDQFYTELIVDVVTNAEPLQDLTGGVPQGGAAARHPAIDAIGAA